MSYIDGSCDSELRITKEERMGKGRRQPKGKN
jgi:hypothetical protein